MKDRKTTPERQAFAKAKKHERNYSAALRKIAKAIHDIVNGFDLEDVSRAFLIEQALEKYAQLIDPWADSVATRMITEVAARDKKAWERVSAQIGRDLMREIEKAPTGVSMRILLNEQVSLIKSLPLDAAKRVHELALEAISNGARSKELAVKIMETGHVVQSRANLIARTETSRVATTLTQVRAQHIGSEEYIWRTSKDSDVRKSHKRLEGKVFRWDSPPICDEPDHRAHPGAIWNCRCYPEPIIPDVDD